MLKIGLTGGIASGKSLAAARLQELGALLVDSDVLARQVVQPGTPGLERVVQAFGGGVLQPNGQLDRPKLGAIVFQEPSKRAVLNSIIHPLVREAAGAIMANAGPGDIVVQDIPLLVETGQGDNFHLVLVVDAPDDVRVRRMVELRGMTAEDARSRMAAQAARSDRMAAADVVLSNTGSKDDLLDTIDDLWRQRLQPFALNLRDGIRADRGAGVVLCPARPEWAQQADRLASRILAAVGGDGLAVDHIGSTAVPGLASKDVLDLQLVVADMTVADRIAPLLSAAGFPAVAGVLQDTPKPSHPDTGQWQKRFHANADPGRAVNLHVRSVGSPGWRFALQFRDWLRAEPGAVLLYEAHKLELAELYADDTDATAYAEAKGPWFTNVAWPLVEEWATRSGWQPPSYSTSADGKSGR